MALESELDLGDLLSSNAFIVKLKQFLADDERVNVLELNREKHLTVALQPLQHLAVAVLEHAKDLLNNLKNLVFSN